MYGSREADRQVLWDDWQLVGESDGDTDSSWGSELGAVAEELPSSDDARHGGSSSSSSGYDSGGTDDGVSSGSVDEETSSDEGAPLPTLWPRPLPAWQPRVAVVDG